MTKAIPNTGRMRSVLLTLPFIITVFAGGGVLLNYLSTMQTRMQDEAMLQNARVYSDVLRSTQAFYASEILPHADPKRINITHDFKNTDHALPYPATLTISFAEYLSENGTNFSAAMLSDYPFPWRSERSLTEFDTRALGSLQSTNGDEYFEFERGIEDENDHLNYARAIRMEASCVACHNSHVDSPKRDWSVGDSRGIYVITLPVNTLAAGLTREFKYLIAILGFATLLTVIGIIVVRQREYRALRKLETRNSELVIANSEKDIANSAKSEFLANISHEIRTPINGILGLTELMILDNPRDDERKRLNRIQSAGGSLLRVINDVLDFSKIEANKLTVEDIPYEIEKLAEDVVGVFVLDQKKGGKPKLFVDIDPLLPARLLGDPHRISQVVTNLLSNAFKFTETGHIVFSIRRDAVRPDLVRFAVMDTGPGIEAKAKAMLFKPFAQADGTVTRRYGGTGLGLAISHDLAQRMGGSLALQTEMGKGSTFEFSLPFRPASPKELSILSTPPKDLSKVHILDTEDARLNIYVRFFNDLGVATEVLSTRAEANTVLAQINGDKAALDEILLVNLDGNVPKDIFTFCGTHQCARLIVLYPPNDTSAANDKPLLQRPLLPTVLMRHIDQKLGNASEPASRVPPIESEQVLPLSGLTVLAVDDNELNRVVIEAFLKRGGAIVHLASSGSEAIEIVSQHPFDVVLMDIQMPDMDGFEAARQIRASGHDIPIIALTAHALIQDKERSALEGMVDHLSKPVSRQELYAVLSQFVTARSTHQDD